MNQVFMLLIGLITVQVRSEHVTFINCENPGWSCKNESIEIQTTELNYDCRTLGNSNNNNYNYRNGYYQPQPALGHEAYVDLSDWDVPETVENITIQNCQSLTLLYHWENCNLTSLTLKNIGSLNLRKGSCEKHPKMLILQDVQNIDVIPANTICDAETESVVFSRVTRIGYIEENAIHAIYAKYFYLYGVNIARMDENAINIKTDENGEIFVDSSTFPTLVPFAMRFEGSKVNLVSSTIAIFSDAAILLKGKQVVLQGNTMTSGGSVIVQSRNVSLHGNYLGRNMGDTILLNYPRKRDSNLLEGNTILSFRDSVKSDNSNSGKRSKTFFYNTSRDNCWSIIKAMDMGKFMDERPKNLTSFVAFIEIHQQRDLVFPVEWIPEVTLCESTAD